jgi:broad specificity phosphatase PhoE
MTALLLLRHAPTAWNATGRLMGRADLPLSAAGRAVLASWRLPSAFDGAPLLASPLRRARETAAAFGPATVEPRLVEMDWGAWEGWTLAERRAADPAGVAAIEARGLDLCPPGGERPRDVVARLAALFADLAGAGPRVLVTHKGVIRAAMAFATGWDYRGPPPVRLRDGEALRSTLDRAGKPLADVAAIPIVEEGRRCGS